MAPRPAVRPRRVHLHSPVAMQFECHYRWHSLSSDSSVTSFASQKSGQTNEDGKTDNIHFAQRHPELYRWSSSCPHQEWNQVLEKRLSDMSTAILDVVWWIETLTLLEALLGDSNRWNESWDTCLAIFEAARDRQEQIPVQILAAVVECGYRADAWERLFQLAQYVVPVSDLFVQNRLYWDPQCGGNSQEAKTVTHLTLYKQLIAACHRLKEWQIALDLLQLCEVTASFESQSDMDLQQQLLLQCIREAMFACCNARQWNRAILVFLRGMEVLPLTDIFKQKKMLQELAHCCGQAGQWTTSLRILDIFYDAFLQFEELSVARLGKSGSIRTGICPLRRLLAKIV